MQCVVLVATHDKRHNRLGEAVPMPLVDVMGEPYLTTLVRWLSVLPDLEVVHVVTNEAIRQKVEEWHSALPPGRVAVTVFSDGTLRQEDRKGAIGDLLLAVEHHHIKDDLIVIGGDNWFTYDLVDFVAKARERCPAVIVTCVAKGARPSRFGWVELDSTGRIVRFTEHPPTEPTEMPLKASCVYYLGAGDLKWLSQFAVEQSTVCSPGTFFSWLAARIPVYGVLQTSYRGGPNDLAVPLPGPDYLEWRDIIRSAANPDYSTWEREAARCLPYVSSHQELAAALRDPNANVRIVAARLLGQSRDLLSSSAREAVIEALLRVLEDPAQNDITSSSFGCDDESAYFVSATAAESLVVLGYAQDTTLVFEKARAAGLPVCECRNKP